MRKIIISESFSREWKNIFLYIKDDFGISVAERINIELEKMLNLLSIFPEIGKPNLKDRKLRTFYFKKNILVFSFQETEIKFLKIINRRSIK